MYDRFNNEITITSKTNSQKTKLSTQYKAYFAVVVIFFRGKKK